MRATYSMKSRAELLGAASGSTRRFLRGRCFCRCCGDCNGAIGAGDTRGPQESDDRVRRLRTLLEPRKCLVTINVNGGRLGQRVVVTNTVDEITVTWGSRLGDDHPIVGL